MELIKYRRQYIISTEKINQLSNWKSHSLNEYHIYLEKSLQIELSQNSSIQAAILGYWVDPENKEYSNKDILDQLVLQCKKVSEVFEFIYNLSGRFLLMFTINKQTYVLNDASGFRPVFYFEKNKKKYLTSSISLLKTIEKVDEKKSLSDYYNSDHYLHTPTYMWHAGFTFYKNVEHLIPNHYLDIKTFGQIRFFPSKENVIVTDPKKIEDIENEITELLKSSIEGLNYRHSLALALSAGNDSRVLLALMKDISKEVLFWISYRSKKEADYFVPKKIVNHFKLRFLPIKNNRPRAFFKKFYKQNTVMAHKIWCEFNYSKLNKFPEDHIVVRGAAAESARNYYYPNYSPIHPEKVTMDYLCTVPNLSFLRIPELHNDFNNWLTSMQKIEKEFDYKTLDFVFWEHREGCWQAQNQLESDYHFEVFVPYNNRKILDLMLSLPSELRDKRNPILYNRLIQNNWPELKSFEINPKDKFSNFELKIRYYKAAIKYKLRKLWIKIN